MGCYREPPGAFPDLGNGASLEKSCREISCYLANLLPDADTNRIGSFYRMLDSSAEELGRSLGTNRASPEAADSILALVYGRWGIAFDSSGMVAAMLLPHQVFLHKRGACLGTSLIMLMVAERIGCPLYGVALPGHFFLRYDNGERRFNIEPNLSGFHHPDDYYRSRYLAAALRWYDLSNLTESQSIGMLCYNAGVLCLRHSRCRQAITFFSEATRRIPELAEARGNLALAYAQTGLTDSSLSIFEHLFAAHPDMPCLAANYGAVALAAERYQIAERVFRKGLQCNPTDSSLLRGLSEACAHLREAPPKGGS